VYAVLQGESLGEHLLVTNARHLHLLQKIAQHLRHIMERLHQKLPGDLLAVDIRSILQNLGEITGEITNDDQLDFIFSKFCIGK
jgi:tRNA modification GTPase